MCYYINFIKKVKYILSFIYLWRCFCAIKFGYLCKPAYNISSFFLEGARYIVSNGYSCLHKLSIFVFSFLFQLTQHYGQVCTPFALNFSSFDSGFLMAGPLTFRRFYDIFSLAKAKTKTCADSKIPREGAIWCKASVTLLPAIPLPSCREEMP